MQAAPYNRHVFVTALPVIAPPQALQHAPQQGQPQAQQQVQQQAPTSWPVAVAAAYRFVGLDDCAALREQLFTSAGAAELKGTVLLASEGINLALAGPPAALQRWLDTLQQDPRFRPLELKLHGADAVPFRHLRVKVKREIIRMNQPAVQPAAGRAPAVDAATLARWLTQGHCDQGRPVLLLDTRNAFEVDAGAFAGALDWRLSKFSDFPAALAAHRGALQGKTVVSYCTGGIRCEKAALWMAEAGVEHVLQLDGGILRYFEQVQGAPHWHGDCVVFDARASVGAAVATASVATASVATPMPMATASAATAA